MAKKHGGVGLSSFFLWAAFVLVAIGGADAQNSIAKTKFSDCLKRTTKVAQNSFEHLPQENQLYDSFAKRIFNSRFHWRKPVFIALPTSSKEVSNTIKCANEAGLKYVVRDGGHSYEGQSLIDQGILIDMSKINWIKVDQKNNRAVIGGGQRLGEVYLTLYENGGYAFSGGNCAAVGVSGLTLGGGIGPNTRRMGMTVDNLVAATVVLADGRIVTASSKSQPDLFWAIRGGSGSFGVVTQWQFSLTPAPSVVTVLEYSWPKSRVRDVFAAIAKWKPYNLPEAYAKIEWFFGFGVINVNVNYWGKKSDVETMMNDCPLYKVGGGGQTFFKELSYMDYAVKVTNLQGDSWWNKENLRVKSIVDLEYGPNAPNNHRANRFKAGSIVLDADLPDEAVAAMSQMVDSNGEGWVQGKAMKGRVSRVAVAATAYPHRNAAWLLQAYTGVSSDSQIEWVASTKRGLTKYGTGLEYMNYIDCAVPKNQAWQRYFGPNAQRLQSIKATYDPNNRFNAINCP